MTEAPHINRLSFVKAETESRAGDEDDPLSTVQSRREAKTNSFRSLLHFNVTENVVCFFFKAEVRQSSFWSTGFLLIDRLATIVKKWTAFMTPEEFVSC